MNSDDLRALQAPLKSRYREQPPEAAVVTLGLVGSSRLKRSPARSRPALLEAGLHPATGGTGVAACSGTCAGGPGGLRRGHARGRCDGTACAHHRGQCPRRRRSRFPRHPRCRQRRAGRLSRRSAQFELESDAPPEQVAEISRPYGTLLRRVPDSAPRQPWPLPTRRRLYGHDHAEHLGQWTRGASCVARLRSFTSRTSPGRASLCVRRAQDCRRLERHDRLDAVARPQHEVSDFLATSPHRRMPQALTSPASSQLSNGDRPSDALTIL